jgi:hypothetical protein
LECLPCCEQEATRRKSTQREPPPGDDGITIRCVTTHVRGTLARGEAPNSGGSERPPIFAIPKQLAFGMCRRAEFATFGTCKEAQSSVFAALRGSECTRNLNSLPRCVTNHSSWHSWAEGAAFTV